MYTIKWFQVLLSNINSSICTQLNGFKYCYLTPIILFNIDNNPYWKIEQFYSTHRWDITGTNNLSQSGPGSNGNESIFPKAPELELHHRMQFRVISRSYPERLNPLFGGYAVSVFHITRWLRYCRNRQRHKRHKSIK